MVTSHPFSAPICGPPRYDPHAPLCMVKRYKIQNWLISSTRKIRYITPSVLGKFQIYPFGGGISMVTTQVFGPLYAGPPTLTSQTPLCIVERCKIQNVAHFLLTEKNVTSRHLF
jgi:hypothetical protein